MPLGADGFRGAVVLRGGRYLVAGRLQIRSSGVVLAGGKEVAALLATGAGRRTLIEIGNTTGPAADAPVQVTDETVPAGGRTLTLETLGALKTGDRVVIVRPSTAEWIAALHMTGLPGAYASQRLDWAPGSRNLVWDRTVTEVDAAHNRITVDAPITTALERRYGGGTVARVISGEPLHPYRTRTPVAGERLRPGQPSRREPLVDGGVARPRGGRLGERRGGAPFRRLGGARGTARAAGEHRAVAQLRARLRAGRIPAAEFPGGGSAGAGPQVRRRTRHERFRERPAGGRSERVPGFDGQQRARPQRFVRELGVGRVCTSASRFGDRASA